METGKHLTTTPKLALMWGRHIVDAGWEDEIGSILEVRVAANIAEDIYFVGANTDGIGACYFARFDQLVCAKFWEAKL